MSSVQMGQGFGIRFPATAESLFLRPELCHHSSLRSGQQAIPNQADSQDRGRHRVGEHLKRPIAVRREFELLAKIDHQLNEDSYGAFGFDAILTSSLDRPVDELPDAGVAHIAEPVGVVGSHGGGHTILERLSGSVTEDRELLSSYGQSLASSSLRPTSVT